MQISEDTAVLAAMVAKRRPTILSILCDDSEWRGVEKVDSGSVARPFQMSALEKALIWSLGSTECPHCSRNNSAEQTVLYFHDSGGLSPLTHATCVRCGEEYRIS